MYKIIRRDRSRFIIVDSDTGEILDDAQGYGYKTKGNAERAAWYKFKGGKAKKDAAKKEANAFWCKHKDFGKALYKLYEMWFKEIARGEIDADNETLELAAEMNIEGFRLEYLEYLQ